MPILYEHFLAKVAVAVDNRARARHYGAVTDALHLLRLIRP
jgi:hypothetical protein